MLSLAGQPLLLPDSDGELLRWQEAFQAACEYDLFAEPAAVISSRNGSNRESNTTAVGLPIANYPEPPEPRINTLYWPTGATRWARGYFMATSLSASAIIKKSSNYTTPLDLKIANSDKASGLTIKVYLLPPQPITGTFPRRPMSIEDQLLLIPVVDERYFWNHNYGIVDLDVDPAVTWAELYDDLMTNIGVAATNAGTIDPPEEYLDPDKTELQRINDNAAVLLDAICLSVGYRFVTKFDGKHTPERTDDSQTVIDERNNVKFQTVAGGTGIPFAAASTFVVFNKYKNGRILESGEQYTKSVALSESTVKSKSGTINVVHTAALADFSPGSHDNTTKCDDLATQIEADYAAWAKNRYDVTIAGVSEDLIPCGYDDSILMTFGAQRHNEEKGEAEYEAHTRVKSYPLNFGVEQQLSQDPYLKVLSHFQDAIPAADVNAGATGNFFIYDAAGDLILDQNDDPQPFKVHNEWGPDLVEDPLTGTGADYDRVRIHWQEETEKWEIIKVKNLPRRGKTAEAFTAGTPATVNVYDDATIITGYTIEAYSFGDIDTDKWVNYTWMNGRWEILSAEC